MERIAMRSRVRASVKQRSVGYLIDVLVWTSFGAIALVVAIMPLFRFWYQRRYNLYAKFDDISFPYLVFSVLLWVWAFTFVVQRVFGATVGMRLCNLRIVSKLTGQKAILCQDLIRALTPLPLVFLILTIIPGAFWLSRHD